MTVEYNETKSIGKKDWTIMVYLAGGSNVSNAARESLLRMKEVGSTENFNVIAQFDTGSEGTATKRYFLTKLEGALVADKVVSKIDTNSLGKQLADLLSRPLPDNQVAKRAAAKKEYERLRKLPVSVGKEKHELGQVLDELLITDDEKKCFRKCLQNPADRQNLRDDPAWLKTCILTCLLEKDRLPPKNPFEKDTKTGNPKVLREFIKWGNKHYDAHHRMVIIWGHGDGFSVAWDATPGSKTPGVRPKNALSPKDLHTAFEVNPKVDIVGFNSCLMGMIEVYHKLSENKKVDYVIASEGYTPTTSWPYDKILSFLQNKPIVEPEDLAKRIVTEYWLHYDGSAVSEEEGIDLSACKIEESMTVALALGDLAKLITEKTKAEKDGKLKRAIVGARMDVQEYSNSRDYVDLSDFCLRLQKKCEQEEVQDPIRKKINTCCQIVIDSVENMVWESKDSGDRVKDSKGLSIYFPTAATEQDLKNYESLKIKETDWSEVLDSYPDWAEEIPKLFTLVRRAIA
jgi:hypothetical protein